MLSRVWWVVTRVHKGKACGSAIVLGRQYVAGKSSKREGLTHKQAEEYHVWYAFQLKGTQWDDVIPEGTELDRMYRTHRDKAGKTVNEAEFAKMMVKLTAEGTEIEGVGFLSVFKAFSPL